MVKKQLWWISTDNNNKEPIPVHNNESWWTPVTAKNLREILKKPEFKEIRDSTHEKINHENTLLAIMNAADLWFDASSTQISDHELWDVPPSAA